MEKERLFKLCDRFSIEGAIGIVLSNHIDIGGDMVGVSVKNFEKAGKMLIEYSEKRSNPKRRPDSNGVLPLTEEELREFEELFGYCNIENLSIGGEAIWINCEVEIMDYKAILYLANLFELEVTE